MFDFPSRISPNNYDEPPLDSIPPELFSLVVSPHLSTPYPYPLNPPPRNKLHNSARYMHPRSNKTYLYLPLPILNRSIERKELKGKIK